MFKVCPACHQEYQRWVVVCSECNVPLTSPEEAASPVGSLPPVTCLALLKIEGPWYLQELAELLQHNGISSRIDAGPPSSPGGGPEVGPRAGSRGAASRLGIYVRAEDLETANEIAEEFATSRQRDVPISVANPDASACPACGGRIPEAAVSCAECGLEFPEMEVE
jgi:hypothetical protein